MSETEQLQAVAGKIAECLSQTGVPMPDPVIVVGADVRAELRPTVNGVEYKILVSVVTD
ncbi:MAG TPA: hypothetical protein VNV38_09450 [Stellaceae bacterium]|jgi:hypothetical protein|nr:hypothetical protein [Stellaceae bacterium]